MLKGPKLLQKEHQSTFIISFPHFERTWFGKYLSQLYVKSYGYFVTNWLPMTIIVFESVRIYHPRFKCKCLKNQKLFIMFSFLFFNLHQVFNILREKMIVLVTWFRKLDTVKGLFRTLSKRHRFRTPFNSQYIKGCQTLAKGSQRELFSHNFHHSERIWYRKYLNQLYVKS